MRILEKYTGEKVYLFPNGAIGTKEAVLDQFPGALSFTFVVETDESRTVMMGMHPLVTLRGIYSIDASLSEDEAIAAIEEIMNTPQPEPEIDETPTAEERIAAALEYQVMASLPDETAETTEAV